MSDSDSTDASDSSTKPLDATLQQLHQALASYRYENTFIKTELAANLDRHKKEINELQMKYDYDIKDALQHKYEAEAAAASLKEQNCIEQRRIQQSNLQLNQKLKLSEEETEEFRSTVLRLQREKSHINEELQQAKHMNSLNAQSLKEEISRLRDEVLSLKNELEKERITSRELTTSIRSEKHENHMLKSKMIEVEKHSEMKISEIQSDINQLTILNVNESDKLKKQINEQKLNLEEERDLVRREREKSATVEKELQDKLNSLKQANIKLKNEHIQETVKLQQQIKKQESEINAASANNNNELLKYKEEISELSKKLYEEQTDKAVIQGRIGLLADLENVLRKEKEESSLLRQDIAKLRGEIETLNDANIKLMSSLREQRERLSEKDSNLASIIAKNNEETITRERILADTKVRQEENLRELQSRVAALQAQLSEKGHHYIEETTSLKQKVRTYGQLIKKLRHKLELCAIREEQLAAEHAALEDHIPPNLYRDIQQQLLNLTRKHAEFTAFIKGMNDCQSDLPQMTELTARFNAISQELADLEESQLHCFSEVESL